MYLAHFRMSIHEFLNKDPDIVPEESPLILFYSKYAMCMAKNGKYTKHTRHIASRMHFLRNEYMCNILHIYWFEGGLLFEDISNKNFGEPDLTPRMK